MCYLYGAYLGTLGTSTIKMGLYIFQIEGRGRHRCAGAIVELHACSRSVQRWSHRTRSDICVGTRKYQRNLVRVLVLSTFISTTY